MKTEYNVETAQHKKVSIFCRLLGHHWRYKDYTNWINEKGDTYDFKASRKCTRCNQHEYLNQEWKPSHEKLPRDVQSDEQSTSHFLRLETH